MFDARIRPLIDPPLDFIGARLAALGFTANAVTLMGAVWGLAAGFCVMQRAWGLVLGCIALSRLMDGLDGAIARHSRVSQFGGYLDIVADFVFYTAIPVGFAVANPEFARPAALLLAAFALTGVSFLAYAVTAGKLGMQTRAHGKKSFFYSTGIAEGAETIALFVLMCLRPDWFPMLAYGFSLLCLATVVQRTLAARNAFAIRDPAD